jgi:hypothetical protein
MNLQKTSIVFALNLIKVYCLAEELQMNSRNLHKILTYVQYIKKWNYHFRYSCGDKKKMNVSIRGRTEYACKTTNGKSFCRRA